MAYQLDIWGGDLHQRLVGSKSFDEWGELSSIAKEATDAGLLCNILHTDFKSPNDLADAEFKRLFASLRGE